MRGLEGRAEAVAGSFKAQELANTLWAYATMGREPGAGVMRGLEGRAEAVAGSFNAQGVANTLWAVCVLAMSNVISNAVVQVLFARLVSLCETPDKSWPLNTADLRQLHQFFVSCSLEEKMRVDKLNDVPALTDACRSAFVRAKTAPSASQQQVSETLRRMGLSVEDEVRCPTSGYSIDMLIHNSALATGGERSSRGGAWAVEFDGPSHFLSSRAPTGATLLKRRHLRLLGHSLVSVPYWEWDACKGPVEREQYLRLKLGTCGPSAAQGDV
jgi:hypothetical protein